MSDTSPLPSDDARAALLRKYRLLCLWRRGKDQSFEADAGIVEDGLASRAAMRALAEEFPGALRELDLLGLAELERRVNVLSHADVPDEPWIAWILGYHSVMRDVLAKKLAAARGGSELLGDRPAGGRLSVAVLSELARRFDVPPSLIAATLFPSRRG